MGKLQLRVLVCGLVLLTAACVPRAEPGISFQEVQAKVAFGAPPPNTDLVNPDAPAETPADVSQFDFSKAIAKRLPPIDTLRRACPQAALSAAAPEEAPLRVKGTPQEGLYRWQRSGTTQVVSPPISFGIGGSENRLVRAVKRINADDFTFETAQPDSSTSQIVVTTFKVRTNPRVEAVPTTDTRVGDPDRGVSIAKIERIDSKTGSPVSVFDPDPDVLVLPLAVLPGERFQGLGFVQGGQMQYDGRVIERRRIDACGDLVDGWFVDGTLTFSFNGQTSAFPYDLNFATQLGGMLIFEYIESVSTQQTTKINFTLGQAKPDPLPEKK